MVVTVRQVNIHWKYLSRGIDWLENLLGESIYRKSIFMLFVKVFIQTFNNMFPEFRRN